LVARHDGTLHQSVAIRTSGFSVGLGLPMGII
jgi:hypothetical protein